ncbi:MAG: VWA domain-containing protein [Campylobacterota bacterium]|nr:VWA domain-containing protein [Campylobacterota bacterium]
MSKILSIFLLLFGLSSCLQGNTQAMIILDASGSMWGQLEGRDKITLSKEALIDSVPYWNRDIKLGLTVFGHKSKSICQGSEIVIPLGSPEASRALVKLQGINPIAKGSIGHALLTASDALNNANDKATIVLISDGQDACHSNPCMIAETLEKQGLDFTAYVIGLDVKENSEEELRCIADLSGGSYYTVTSSEALNRSLEKIVQKINSDKPKMKNVRITASEKENSRDIEAFHQIFKVVDGNLEKEPTVACYSKPEEACFRHLSKGHYRVKTHYKGMSKESPLFVKPKLVRYLHVSLNETAKVEIIVRDKKGGKRLEADHILYKIRDGKIEKEETAKCFSGEYESCLGRIATGQYLLRSQTDTLIKKSVIEVVAGDINAIDVYMGELGRIEISARSGSAQVKTFHTIFKIGQKESISTCYSDLKKPCVKSLPAGHYRVTSEYKNLKEENRFELKGDESSRLRMIFSSTNN